MRVPGAAAARASVGLGLLAVAGLIVAAQASNGVRRVGLDFVARYAGGLVLRDGGSPYDDAAVFAREAELGDGTATNLALFDAPPVLGVFRFLAHLSLDTAAAVWLALSAVCLTLVVLAVTRGAGWWLAVVGVPIVVTFAPVRHGLQLGQIDPVFIAVLAAALLWGATRDFDGTEAFFVPLAVLKPQIMVLPMAVIAVRAVWARPVRAVASAAVGAGVVVGFSLLVAREASWADWLDAVSDRRSERGDASWWATVAFAGVGVVIAARWLKVRARAASAREWVMVAAAANAVLAVTGTWNPQWFIAFGLPLGVLLVAVRSGGVDLAPADRALLVVICGVVAGAAATSPVRTDGYDSAIAPVVGVCALLAGLVLLRELGWVTAVGVAAVNVAVVSIPVRADVWPVLAVAASVGVLSLVTRHPMVIGDDVGPRVALPGGLDRRLVPAGRDASLPGHMPVA